MFHFCFFFFFRRSDWRRRVLSLANSGGHLHERVLMPEVVDELLRFIALVLPKQIQTSEHNGIELRSSQMTSVRVWTRFSTFNFSERITSGYTPLPLAQQDK